MEAPLSPAGWYRGVCTGAWHSALGSCLPGQVGAGRLAQEAGRSEPGQGLQSLALGVGTGALGLCLLALHSGRQASAYGTEEFHKSRRRNWNQRVNGFWALRKVY